MLSWAGNLYRLSRAGYVMTREGMLRFVPQEQWPFFARLAVKTARLIEKRQQARRSTSLSKAFTRLGPSWIKLGQFLSTRPDIVGATLARDLEDLQDRLPPFPQAKAEKALEAAFGRSAKESFVSFGPAVAAASIAQVHRAQLSRNGVIEDVAVKILRPGIERRFRRDLQAFFAGARLIEKISPASRRLKPVGAVETLAHSVAVEMDLRLEAAALSEMLENTTEDESFTLPAVRWERVTKNVLTTQWVEGLPLKDLTGLKAAGHDLKQLARTVMQTFLRHALRDGFFHADMHQGNLFVDAQGRLVAVDFGIMGRLGEKERRFLAEILWSLIRRDYSRGADVHFEAGYVPSHQSRALFAQALRAIGEPIQQKKASEISMAQVLDQLIEYTELFDMHTRLELILLQKTMVVTEGVARTLDPELDMWATAEPVVQEWMRDKLGPKGQAKLALQSGQALGRFLADLPQHIQDFETIAAGFAEMARSGVHVSKESLALLDAARLRAARWQTAALWAIALALLAGLFFR